MHSDKLKMFLFVYAQQQAENVIVSICLFYCNAAAFWK
jgi:hypothetical protein